MRRSFTCVDDFRDHVGGRPARSALTGAISIAIQRNAPNKGDVVLKTKRVPLIVFALVLALLSRVAGAFCLNNVSQSTTTLDSVNIGDATSESTHNLQDWSDVQSGCGWCGPDGNMRLIWGADGGATCDPADNWASVDLDAGANVAHSLVVEHLDGTGDDGFDVYVNNNYVGTYVDAYSTNTWVSDEFVLSGSCSGLLTIKFVPTGSAWDGCPTYGQVAFNRIELKALESTINLEDIDPGLISPTGEYRWRDVADQPYSEDYRTNYNYTQASVQVTYHPVANTLHGTLTGTNLKPNFAYQLKLLGYPGTPANETLGLTGRWWEEEWNGSEWSNGHNLNNKGDGSFPNPNDTTYFSRRDVADLTSPTGLKYRYTGYLLFDYFITDEDDNAVLNFDQDSSYHVLFTTSQRARGANDGPLKTTTFDADPSSPAYDVDYPSQTVSIFGEWERLPTGGVYLPAGDYLVRIMLTEESFHGSGGDYAGNWAAAMGAEIEFTIVPESPTAPVVGDIPDQTIAEGESFVSINLDDYVTDTDNTPDQMTWTYAGNSELSVTIADRVATISIPNPDWNGSETITFTATDPDNQSDNDYATFTITPVNDSPVVGDIPDQTIAEGESFVSINLDDYVSDVDNSDAEMAWTYSGNSELSVTIVDRVATVSVPHPDWNGSETITFTATDPEGASDSDDATFTATVLSCGTIQGIVEVQGRPGDWGGAQITVSGGPGGPYNTTVTNSDGSWSISGILAGTYDVEVEMGRYLDGLKTGVSVSAGGTTDVGQVKVLGGDCNDSDGPPDFTYGVDILDAGITGNAFDSVPTDPNWDAKADVNDDGKVNTLDAVFVGGNWHKSSSVNWP